MQRDTVFMRDPAEKDADAGLEGETLAFRLFQVGLVIEGRGLEFRIGARRQVKDRDRDPARGIFEIACGSSNGAPKSAATGSIAMFG